MITGAVVSPTPPVEDVLRLFNLGAKFMRWQLTFIHEEWETKEKWEAGVYERLALMDAILPHVPIKVVLDVHTPPGGYDNGTLAMFTEKAPWGRQVFIDMWKTMAERYKGNSQVAVYDLLNEPLGTTLQVNSLMRETFKAIKAIDSKKYISVECQNGNPGKFDRLEVLPSSRVYYQAHMYTPPGFTHQGIYGHPVGRKYPGVGYDKERLKKILEKPRKFQLKHKVPIYIGEFGVSIYTDADSRFNYFRDVLEICTEWKWHWTFHSWGEAHVWSIEDDARIMELFRSYL